MKRTKKVLLASLFGCLFLCLGGSATKSYATTNLTVTDFAGLQNAFTTANANTAEDYVVTVNDTIQATAPLALDSAKMTLTGNGTILGDSVPTIGISAENSSLTIDGITIKNYRYKGAIELNYSRFVLKSGTISDNKNTRGIDSNYMLRSGGGAITAYENSRLTITGGKISNNISTGLGGGIYAEGGSTVDFQDGEISNNTAQYGGGIYNDCRDWARLPASAANVYPIVEVFCIEIEGGTISNNSAIKDGGGVFAGPETNLVMDSGTITDNSADRNGDGVFVYSSSTENDITAGKTAPKASIYLSDDAFINKNNDVYLDGTDTAINVDSKLNKVTSETPIVLTPGDTTTVSTKTGVAGNKLVNYFSDSAALEADANGYFVLSDKVPADLRIAQSDFINEENFLILSKRTVSLFLKFSGIDDATDETLSLTKNDVITKSPAYQAVLAKYAKKGYTLEFYTDQEYKNLLPADQSIVEDTTLYARYVKNPNTLDSVAIYAIIGIATIAGASILLKSQKRSRR